MLPNNIVSKVNFRSNVLHGVFAFSDYKTKLILTNSLIVSVTGVMVLHGAGGTIHALLLL